MKIYIEDVEDGPLIYGVHIWCVFVCVSAAVGLRSSWDPHPDGTDEAPCSGTAGLATQHHTHQTCSRHTALGVC